MSESKSTFLAIFVSGVVLVIWQFFFGPAGHGHHLEDLQALVRAHLEDFAFQILFAGLVLLTAVGLYLLRLKMRRSYATLEIAFGAAASMYAANAFYDASVAGDRVKAIVATIAGVYIIVRGLDNWHEGAKAAAEFAKKQAESVNTIVRSTPRSLVGRLTGLPKSEKK